MVVANWAPLDPNIIYILEEAGVTNIEIQNLYRSTNGGTSFSLLSNGLPTPGANDLRRGEIAVTPAAPDNLYLVLSGSDGVESGLWGVYVSTNKGDNFTFQCCGATPGPPYSATDPNILGYAANGSTEGGQLNFQQSLFADPTNANILYSGGVYPWKSTDMGATWTYLGADVHADNHNILVADNKIYTVSDGGLYRSDNGGTTWTVLTNGIYGTEFWYEFGFSRKNAEVMIGGTIHNGDFLKYENQYANWRRYDSGDTYNGYVDASQAVYRVRPASVNYGIRRSKDKGANFASLPVASRFIQAHPRSPSVLYAPDNGLYNLWKSTDFGANWTKITNFPVAPATSVGINEIAICDSNPDVIALNLRDSREVAITTNGGTTWTVSAIPVHGTTKLSDLIIDDLNPLNMWMLYDRGYVHKSTDGGATWPDYSTGIGTSTNLMAMVHHVGTDGAVYIASDIAVYFRDNNAASWSNYSTGLPIYPDLRDIGIVYDNSKLRVSGMRSVWQSDLNTTATTIKAAFAAENLVINNCENILVKFYDASFVPTAGTTWQWTFTGGSPASSTLQNPEVSYSTPGTYTVSLTITNGANSSTTTVSNMITVGTITTYPLPFLENIESFTLTGTPPCNPTAALGNSLTNATNFQFPADAGDWQVNDGPGIRPDTGPEMDYNPGTPTGKYLYLRGSNLKMQ